MQWEVRVRGLHDPTFGGAAEAFKSSLCRAIAKSISRKAATPQNKHARIYRWGTRSQINSCHLYRTVLNYNISCSRLFFFASLRLCVKTSDFPNRTTPRQNFRTIPGPIRSVSKVKSSSKHVPESKVNPQPRESIAQLGRPDFSHLRVQDIELRQVG